MPINYTKMSTYGERFSSTIQELPFISQFIVLKTRHEISQKYQDVLLLFVTGILCIIVTMCNLCHFYRSESQYQIVHGFVITYNGVRLAYKL